MRRKGRRGCYRKEMGDEVVTRRVVGSGDMRSKGRRGIYRRRWEWGT